MRTGKVPPAGELRVRFGAPDDLAEVDRNVINAKVGELIVKRYGARPGQEPYDDDPDTVIADLICNLLHTVTVAGGEPGEVVERALNHFYSEVGAGYGTG